MRVQSAHYRIEPLSVFEMQEAVPNQRQRWLRTGCTKRAWNIWVGVRVVSCCAPWEAPYTAVVREVFHTAFDSRIRSLRKSVACDKVTERFVVPFGEQT